MDDNHVSLLTRLHIKKNSLDIYLFDIWKQYSFLSKNGCKCTALDV